MSDPAANKQAALRFYRDILAAGAQAGLEEIVAEDYRSHLPDHRAMPTLAPGREALRKRLAMVGPIAATPKRVVADGDLVFAQVLFESGTPVNGVDIFRFGTDGRIAEHWAVRQPLAGEDSATIARRFDGPGNAEAGTPAEAIRANKARARDLYALMWSKGDPDLVPVFHAPAYIQHNPHIASGAERIRAMIADDIRDYMAKTGGDFPIALHRIGAEGDLVFAHFDIEMVGLGRNTGDRSSIVDIFRVEADGRFGEHWDVCQMESDNLPDEGTLF